MRQRGKGKWDRQVLSLTRPNVAGRGAGKRHSSGKRTGIEGLVVILVLLLR